MKSGCRRGWGLFKSKILVIFVNIFCKLEFKILLDLAVYSNPAD